MSNIGYNSGYNQNYGVNNNAINNVNQQGYGSSNINNQVVNVNSVDEYNHADNSHIFSKLESLVTKYGSDVAVPVAAKPQTPQEQQEARLQSQKAHYSFATTMDNNIEGNYLQQVETRRDGKVFGRYSYDDGNNFVTRFYIADENGFRIVKWVLIF